MTFWYEAQAALSFLRSSQTKEEDETLHRQKSSWNVTHVCQKCLEQEWKFRANSRLRLTRTSCSLRIFHPPETIVTIVNKGNKIGYKKAPPVGLEPTTFELEVQHANPLRHGGFTYQCQTSFQLSFSIFISRHINIIFPQFFLEISWLLRTKTSWWIQRYLSTGWYVKHLITTIILL